MERDALVCWTSGLAGGDPPNASPRINEKLGGAARTANWGFDTCRDRPFGGLDCRNGTVHGLRQVVLGLGWGSATKFKLRLHDPYEFAFAAISTRPLS
jgi:hypothetical protein